MPTFKNARPPRSADAPVYNRTIVWDESLVDDEEKKVFVGTTVEGVYIERRENVGQNKANVYVVKMDEETVQIWGSTVLDDYMLRGNDGEPIEKGSVVRIINLGKRPGKKYYDFDVQFATDENVDVDEVPPAKKPVAKTTTAKPAVKPSVKAPKAAPVEEEVDETEDGEESDEDGEEEEEQDFA